MFRIKASDLNSALKICRFAVNPRSSIPTLGCVRVTGFGDKARISATDLEVMVEVTVPAQGEIDVCLNHKHLRDLRLRGEVCMDLIDENQTALECDGIVAELFSPKGEELPMSPVCDAGSIQIERFDLANIFGLIPFCCEDYSREVLCGVRIESSKAVATNTHMLGVADLEVNMPDMIIPASALKVLKSVLPPNCSNVEVSWSYYQLPEKAGDEAKALSAAVKQCAEEMVAGPKVKNLKFRSGNMEMSCKIPDYGYVYPNWRRVVPDEIGNEICVASAYCLEALHDVLPAAANNSDTAQLQFADDNMHITAGDSRLLVTRSVPCRFDDEVVSQYFTVSYLIELIKYVGKDAFKLWQYDVTQPVMAKCGSRMVVLMPKAIDDEHKAPRRISDAQAVGV